MDKQDTATDPQETGPTSTGASTVVRLLDEALRAGGTVESSVEPLQSAVNRLAVELTKTVRQRPIQIHLTSEGPKADPDSLVEGENCASSWLDLFDGGLRGLRFHPGIGRTEVQSLVEVLRPETTHDADETLELDPSRRDRVTDLWRCSLEHVDLLVSRADFHSKGQPSSPQLSPQEQYERWHALLSEGGQSTLSPGGLTLEHQDFRALILKGQDFDWIRLSGEPKPADRNRRKRPRIATAIDQELEDLSSYLALVDAAGSPAFRGVKDLLGALLRLGARDRQAALLEALIQHPQLGSKLVPELLHRWEHSGDLRESIEMGPSQFESALKALVNGSPTEVLPLVQHFSSGEAHRILEELLTEAIAQPIAEHGAQIDSKDPKQSLRSVEKLLKLSSSEAFTVAMRGFATPHPEVRTRVLQALVKRKEPDVSEVLPAALIDEEKMVRILGLRLTGKTGGNANLRLVLDRVKQKDFAKLDLDEQLACVRALGPHSRLPLIHRYLCGAAQSLRLFGGKGAQQFQAEIVRWLVRSSNREAAQIVDKILGKWSTPPEIKEAIRQERAHKKHKRPDTEPENSPPEGNQS